MKSLRPLGFVLVALMLSQCAPDPPKLINVKIAVSLTPLSTAFFVAESSGYFRQCGLLPELIQVNGGKRAFELLEENRVDFSTSSDSVVSYAVQQNTTPFNILASFASSENDIKLISRQPEPLPANSTLGYWSGSASEHLMQTYLALYQSDKTFDQVDAPPEQLVSLFREGKVDVISVWEPFAWQMTDLIEQNDAHVLDAAALHSLHFLLLSNQNSKLDRTVAERLIGALQLATIKVHQHPQEVQQEIRTVLNADQSFIDWIWNDYLFQVKPATSVRYALLSNSRWFNGSRPLNYQNYLANAESLASPSDLAEQWCQDT
ncbi:hypothetical protein MED297_11680 [Reinekea sp. MED297]|uniref:SsuA/THI5-like domain-containing protein n=2 Tax=Reinekea TaxID=230494 RepID=A4BB61_9GAMM|nr:hypothetical protein MED297_11680 [Reinekea sp. MED297] [Reinekea blandensis MED297]